MHISMAPMEGITTYIYRQLSARFFRPADRYYTPYISPAVERLFSARDLTEILPENNTGLHVIPQLMVNRADLCIAAIHELKEMGYHEVNLNFGCPSGNVTRKRKGSGILAYPDELARFLDEVFSGTELPISVKTRIGYHAPEEFTRLLRIFRNYPFCEMILHPRVRDEFYNSSIHMDMFLDALNQSPFPLVYNGEIRTREDLSLWKNRCCTPHPNESNSAPLSGIMIGRGLIAQPDLLSPYPASPDQLQDFYRELEGSYRQFLPDETAVLVKMKRIMTLRLSVLPHTTEQRIRILSARTLKEFHDALTLHIDSPLTEH